MGRDKGMLCHACHVCQGGWEARVSSHSYTSHLHSTSPKAAEAARLLLSDMWANKELQGVLRQVRAHTTNPSDELFPQLTLY